jgi:hypothetical protein
MLGRRLAFVFVCAHARACDVFILTSSARNRNSEVPAYFLKSKEGCTVSKTGEDKWI